MSKKEREWERGSMSEVGKEEERKKWTGKGKENWRVERQKRIVQI